MTRTEIDTIRLWRHDCEGRGLSPGVIKEYERYLERYREDSRPLLDSTTQDLSVYLLEHTDRWCPSTRMVVRRAFRSFFKFALEIGSVDENPALGIRAVKVPLSPVRTPGPDERAGLVRACGTARDRAIIEMLFGTGMRRGELVALRVGDVDLGERTIEIAKSKNGRPRTAVMDERAHRALVDWLEVRAVHALDHDWLWTTVRGDRLREDGVKTAIRRASDHAGIKFTAHDARRAFAVAWLSVGGSESGLMAICGWSSHTMVVRYVRECQAALAIGEARRLFEA